MRIEARVILWGLILLMPLGTASFEVLGRASNVGYGVLFLAFCLLVYRRSISVTHTPYVYGVDALLFLCANTNPLCYPLIFVDFSLQAYEVKKQGPGEFLNYFRVSPALRSAVLLFLTLAFCAIWVVLREKGGDSFLGGDLKLSSLTEMFFARSFLYMLVFSVYGCLTDSTSIILSAALICLFLWLAKGAQVVERKFIISIAIVFLFATAATILGRPGLTNFLSAYTSTHLDRYYFGLSFFVALILCAGFSAALGQAIRVKGLVVSFACGGLVALYLGSATYFFEFDKPRWSDLPQQDLRSSLIRAYANTDLAETSAAGVRYRVDLHPKPWVTHFPEKNVLATLRDGRGYIGEISPSKEQSQARVASVVSRYEGKVIRQTPLSRGREDGWFLVKEGRRFWISGPRWLEINALSSKDVVEIPSEEFILIPDSGESLS